MHRKTPVPESSFLLKLQDPGLWFAKVCLLFNKFATWKLQHFYHKAFVNNAHQVRCYHFFIFEVIAESVNLITDVKIEQKIISPWWRTITFLKNLHQNTQSKKKDVLVIILLQKTKNSNLYNKNYAQNIKTRASNNIFNMKKVDLDES